MRRGVQTVPVWCREAEGKKRFSFSFRRLLGSRSQALRLSTSITSLRDGA